MTSDRPDPHGAPEGRDPVHDAQQDASQPGPQPGPDAQQVGPQPGQHPGPAAGQPDIHEQPTRALPPQPPAPAPDAPGQLGEDHPAAARWQGDPADHGSSLPASEAGWQTDPRWHGGTPDWHAQQHWYGNPGGASHHDWQGHPEAAHYGGGAQYPPAYAGAAAGGQQPRSRRSIGVGGFIVGVVIAGLLGGGIGAGATGLISGQDVDPSSGIQINNPEDATAVTAAASKASPSVVTLGVSDGSNAGSGSGIVLDDQGHVLTNTHVVTLGGTTASPTIEARMSDGSVSSAEVVGTDPLSDLAVVKLEDTEGLEPAELGSSGDLNVGDQAVAIGAPLGLSGTVTDGIVSTLDRTISVASSAVDEEDTGDQPNDAPDGNGSPGDEDSDGFEFFFPDMESQADQGEIYINVIQTDAAINRGNSGGALVDDEGKVIGVNVAIASAGGGAETEAGSIGVGFAIPIDYAKRVAEDIIDNGEVSHGLLGVTVAAAGPDSAEGSSGGDASNQSGQGFTTGALVDEVADGSPGAEGGLKQGDVITSVDGRQVQDSISLTAMVREYAAGDSISVTYQRGGQEHTTDVTLEGM